MLVFSCKGFLNDSQRIANVVLKSKLEGRWGGELERIIH